MNAAAYYRLRKVSPTSLSEVEKAYRFFALNRWCFNGIYRTNRSGEFNVPFGKRTGRLPNRGELKSAASALSAARLVSGDFSATLEGVRRRDIVYLDPPYHSPARLALGEYGYGSFGPEDLERFVAEASKAAGLGAHVLISYRESRQLRKALRKWEFLTISVRRQVAGSSRFRGSAHELLISNRPLPRIVKDALLQ